MRKLLLLITAGALVLAACSTEAPVTASGTVAPSAATVSTTTDTIAATASAAQDFLDTLSAEQREQVLYSFDDDTKSTSWSNFPLSFVQRSGMTLGELNEQQQQAALKVLEELLNDDAYSKMVGIMEGDQYLADYAGASELGETQYNIAFFGEPTETGDWAIQFGGHHIGINATLSNGAITFAPTHLGTQPTTYVDDTGRVNSALGGMYDTAFAFYESLSTEQQAQLYQGQQVRNLVCAPGGECDYPTGTGLKGEQLRDAQKELLLAVIANWVDMADAETTRSELEAIAQTLDETYIAWSGATEYDTSEGDGVYVQISGPKVYIELASQQGSAGADIAGVDTSGWGHIHSIYRDPTNDYAGSVTQQAATGGPRMP